LKAGDMAGALLWYNRFQMNEWSRSRTTK